MYIIETPYSNLFSSFRAENKQYLQKNLDVFARSFDESLIRRLKDLSNQPAISLSWMLSSVDFVSSIHAEAQVLFSNLMISGAIENSLGCYFDDSLKLLYVCNSISSKIEQLKQRRFLISFVLHLLKPCGDDSQVPAPEKLRKAKDTLSDWQNFSNCFSKRCFQIDAEALVRDLATKNAKFSYGKITTVEKLVHRTIYAVRLITVSIIGIITSAMYGTSEHVHVRAPTEFPWADSFNNLESTIAEKLKRRFGGTEKKEMFEEMDNLTTNVRILSNVVNNSVVKVDDINTAVKKVEKEMEIFSNGSERLSNGVNKLFHTVLCTRNGLLDNYKTGQNGQQKEKRK